MTPTSTRNLERVPPEIWQEIINYACTDGGATGRSLALTSKFFRGQSLNARFHSLAFRATNRLLVFLLSLRVQPRECRPRIRHISLAPTLYSGSLPRSLRHLAGNPGAGHMTDSTEFCTNAIEALFSFVARQLQTLCLIASTAALFRHFTQAFPQLEELSMWNHPLCQPPGQHMPSGSGSLGPDTQSPVDEPDARGAGPTPLFPSLKRLHCVLTEPSMTFKRVLLSLPALASATLTHLRLSGVTYLDEALPTMLAELLGVPVPRPLRERIQQGIGSLTNAAHAQPIVRSGAVFPSLRHVVIYAVQPRVDGDSEDRFAFSKWAVLLGLLRELERTCKRVSGMRMVVLERSWLRKSRWANRLHADWLQRMEGGRGCWVESEAEESAIEGPLKAPQEGEW